MNVSLEGLLKYYIQGGRVWENKGRGKGRGIAEEGGKRAIERGGGEGGERGERERGEGI